MWSAEGRADRPFLQAYRRSAQRYTVIRGAVGDPDPFRVKYRQAIAEQVAEIIRARCGRRDAVASLRRWAEDSVGRGRLASARGVCGMPMHKRLVDLTTVPHL